MTSFLKGFIFGVFKWIKRHWKLSLILLVVGGLIGLNRYNAWKANKPVLTFQKPVVQDLVKTLDVSGVVDAKEKARLRFAAGGKVVYLGAKEGATVKKWQTIATIDGATLQKQLQQDLNTYLQQRYNNDYYIVDNKDDYWKQSIVRNKTDNQLDLENEVLNVEIRDIAIRNTVLSAPFAGVLTVSPTTVTGVSLLSSDYFELVNPATLIFRAEIDEADISQVKPGQLATIRLDAYQDKTFTASVGYIPFTSSQTSTATVFLTEIPLPNPDLSTFRLGMNGDVSIELDRAPQALTIPLIATRERDDKTYVDVRTGPETYQEREIKLGLEGDEEVQVVEGLKADEEVLIPTN